MNLRFVVVRRQAPQEYSQLFRTCLVAEMQAVQSVMGYQTARVNQNSLSGLLVLHADKVV